jgi:hypothetical protein
MILSRIQRLVFVLPVLFFCTGFDQVTKDIARAGLASSPLISLLNDIIRIQYSENSVGFVLIWLPIWGYYGIRTIRKALSTRTSFPLKKAEGRVNIIKVESYSNSTHMQTEDYELHIDGEEFDCDSELADILMQGDTYAVYYIQDTKEIMSAEMLAKGK